MSATDDPKSADPLSQGEPAAADDRLTRILGDPTLPDRDKRQAIHEALEELQRERGEEPAAAYEPVERRFFEALSLLADGGHDYDDVAPSDSAALPESYRSDVRD